MAGLRASNLARLNSENDSAVGGGGGDRMLNQKAAAAAAGVGRTTRGRLAMTDIANSQAVATKPALRAKDANVVKPPRMMVKQKATTSLRPLASTQQPKPLIDENKASLRIRKRKCSAEKEEPMEVEGVSALDPHQQHDVDMEIEPQQQQQGFSTANLCKFGVEDIDAEDADDPQLAVQYVNEIYEYMRQLERRQPVRKAYLTDRPAAASSAILPKMRSVLVDWLVEVHQQFSLLQETLYLTVAVLDRFMQSCAEKLPRKQLQLVGVTAMFVAAKYEEMYAPEIGDFVYITDNAYSQSQIRDLEVKMLQALRFDLGRPLPLHFLRRNSKAGQVDATAHTMAKYVMELTLVDYDFAHVPPSEVAAAALAFSLGVLDEDGRGLAEVWNPTLAYFSHYGLDDIKQTVGALAQVVLKTARAPENAKMMAVRKKYANKKFGKISEFLELSGPAAEELAEGNF